MSIRRLQKRGTGASQFPPVGVFLPVSMMIVARSTCSKRPGRHPDRQTRCCMGKPPMMKMRMSCCPRLLAQPHSYHLGTLCWRWSNDRLSVIVRLTSLPLRAQRLSRVGNDSVSLGRRGTMYIYYIYVLGKLGTRYQEPHGPGKSTSQDENSPNRYNSCMHKVRTSRCKHHLAYEIAHRCMHSQIQASIAGKIIT